MAYYIFNADFTASTFSPTGAVAGLSQSYSQGDVVEATTQSDSSGNSYLVTSDGYDITSANTSPVNIVPNWSGMGASGATGMGWNQGATGMGHMHHHGGMGSHGGNDGGMGQNGMQAPEGKQFCAPCRMNAIKKFMKKQYIYAGILGLVLIGGILLYVIKKETIIHPVLFGIIMGIAAVGLVQVMRGIHELHKLKDSLIVIQ
jgi:hypothetical protein